ncbi:bifunctional phosphoribosyl-AMP cyclohydrolase/phosphoribosyl-ATP diphosphatase HisIE [Endozoicomonas sp. Mp262]|uniref:bifunctional phosphoribosyl-AMP cyclohydrolase/phosphoribosyl-ATP diphosphatase HisIE n=1 Tax=Endozoicomonas sp. Mp262 TaxID=2919499 RepID=UPI0021D9FA97
MSLIEAIDWNKNNGLVPAIIQDNSSCQVLMLGYMNKEALLTTLETEWVTFWSRTKERLWTKGETSGNKLRLKSIGLDCDQDTLLVKAAPEGPTCHLNTTTCFDSGPYPTEPDPENTSLLFLGQLEKVLAERKKASPESSYTASLYAKGSKRIAQKVGEEGVEVALAAVAGDKEELINESSDLIYHLLVLLQDQGLTLSGIVEKLKERHQS